MEQKSVYSKLLIDSRKLKPLVEDLEAVKPKNGSIQILIVTEKQYSEIIYLSGDSQTTIINSQEQVIVL